VASQWASQDLSGALAWLQQMPEGRTKLEALNTISYQWAQADPQSAA
jgi:hypothetical protein